VSPARSFRAPITGGRTLLELVDSPAQRAFGDVAGSPQHDATTFRPIGMTPTGASRARLAMTNPNPRPGGDMGETPAEIDEMGPVDYLVVEFPAGHSTFNGEMATELSRLSDEGIIRILDLLVLQKADDGSVEGFEVDDFDMDDLRALESEIAEILAAEDVEHLAAAMEPGSVAGVVVWENLWAAPFASAARRAGGQLVATGRIPIQAIAASLDAESQEVQ
jgi:hypothetical protein